MIRFLLLIFLCFFNLYCSCNNLPNNVISNFDTKIDADTTVCPGAYSTNLYLKLLANKRIGIVTNQTGTIKEKHIVDSLLSLKIHIVRIFCPEHGFRGNADAGASVNNSCDSITGIKIVSLYGGQNKKPKQSDFEDLDLILFDIQDVGVRFYTYISTLHYVMETCAETNTPLIILDRPNPNAHYVDGPVLDTSKFRSFIGMHPVPIVYGMTIGEYAYMINGEEWLNNKLKCNLTVIPCKNYNHKTYYEIKIKPSPNLPNKRAIALYPSLCLFEATTLSVGRGTDKAFQVIGHPLLKSIKEANYTFTPKPNIGASKPDWNNKECYGFDLSENNSIFNLKTNMLNIEILIKVYNIFPDKQVFFRKSNILELLIGYSDFKNQIINNIDEQTIRKSWETKLNEFKIIRQKYLIYED